MHSVSYLFSLKIANFMKVIISGVLQYPSKVLVLCEGMSNTFNFSASTRL